MLKHKFRGCSSSTSASIRILFRPFLLQLGMGEAVRRSAKEQLSNRLASAILIDAHLSHSHRFGRAPYIGKGSARPIRDQAIEKCHVIENMIFSKNK